MRRLERANRRAAYEAAGLPMPARAAAPQTKAESRPLPPPPEEGPDHEKLFELSRGARNQGSMFYYFPVPDKMKEDAIDLNRVVKEEETQNAELKDRTEQFPDKALFDFFGRLEEMGEENRRQQIER